MKDAFKIYKNDMKNILKNYGALIVVIALCILPSLYAWFNIKASWDPYAESATSGIKIGVVNKDLGATLNGKEVNLGNDVVDELKNNKQMGWQFVSEEEATKNVEEGKYYAMITIPEDFSKSLTSIITQDIEKGNIIYTVNEKINAIAPKLTDKGASAIQEKVSKAVVETASDAIFGVGKDLGTELENQLPRLNNIYNQLLEVQSQFSNINDVVNLAGDGADKLKTLISDIQNDIPLITETLENSQKLGTNLEEFLSTSKSNLNNIAPVIKNDIKILNEIANEISTNTDKSNSKIDIEEELRYMTEAKNKAEKEKARLESNMEKMKQQQREKEQRKTTISDNELKRISSIAKTEQALALFESNFDIIKNNKSIIKNDTDLKIRVEILNQRLTDFINSLTNN